MKYQILTFILLIGFSFSFAQSNTELVLHFQQNEQMPSSIRYKTKFLSSEKAQQSLTKILKQLFLKGYIEASIDSTVLQTQFLHVYVYLGEKYAFSALENGNLIPELLKKIKLDTKNKNVTVFSFAALEKMRNDILHFYENRGYPFAEVYLDSIEIANGKIKSRIFAEPHEVFTIDTIIIIGNTKTKSRFIQNYLDIKIESLYSQSKIDEISAKLAQLSFVTETQSPELVFENNKVSIYVYLDKQKSNQFDLLLGIAPNSSLTKNSINITGDGRLHLRNSFGVGEEIYADFKQLKPRTQNFDFKLVYPFFLNIPFGIQADFSLFKNDTLFLNLDSKAAVLYPFNGADYIQLFYQNKVSNVINYDTASVRQSQTLPNVLDISDNRFGLALHFQQLDYVLNPRKGYDISIESAFGTKKIRENASLKKINEKIYNAIDLQSINLSIHTEFKYNIPILKRHSFLLANRSKFFISKNILLNEMFRLGGAKSLRGFDEDEIFSPYYSLFTLEYHFLLSKNTYFYTFGDFAIVEDLRFQTKKIDTPFGFGLGAAIETKGGIFSISYALGKQLDNNLDFKNGKIHFGYINLF